MNDRFSAQLRQHLLDTADERPGDGQLEMVVGGVAHTQQRHPWLARLTWNPGRIGLFPAAAARVGLVVAALALAMGGGAMLAGGAGPTTVFDGTWTATDPGDGSVMILVVGPGNTPAVYFEDGYATGPACPNDVVKRFTARGTGEITGNRLVAEFPDGGGCGLVTVEVAGDFDYRAADDTLVDPDGLTWTRALGGRSATPAPATQAPATQLPATYAPSTGPVPTEGAEPSAAQGPECLEFDAGGTYRATAGDGVDVIATVPAGDGTWSGSTGLFNLARAPCRDRAPVVIEASIVHDVFADACDLEGETRRVSGAREAIEALVAQEGHVLTGPTDATIAGLPASRLEISVPPTFDTSTCTREVIRLWIGTNDTGIDAGETMTVYIVDVDGLALAVHAPFSQETMTPALITEVEGIIASMQIEPQPAR